MAMPLNTPIQNWRGQKVWIVGASSGIGLALAQRLHDEGAQVLVSARRAEVLNTWCADRKGTWAYPFDVSDAAGLAQQWALLVAEHGAPDVVVYAAGHYLPMRAEAFSYAEIAKHTDINYLGMARVLEVVIPAFLKLGKGHIALISSVAGYRGLPNALAYGPTKAAMSNLAEILYHDLHSRGIGVSLINPGFVETPLTAQNPYHMPALLKPSQAADEMLKGWAKGLFEIHFPKRFTLWLRWARWLPDSVYFYLLQKIAP